MPFQQVAWYFKAAGGYIVVSETHWNLLLYYLTGPGGRKTYFQLVPTVQGNELTIEALIDKSKLTGDDEENQNLALICFMFLQNDSKIDLVVDCNKIQERGMQTTVCWKGMYLDLIKSQVYFDHHRYIDPFDKDRDKDQRGCIAIYNDTFGTEPNSAFIMDSDQRLRKWKTHNPGVVTISSKKRTFTKPTNFNHKLTPIGCHYLKSNFLQENGRLFDTVYIMQQCFDSTKNLPRSKRYVMCIDNMSQDTKTMDPRKFRLFGVSEDVVSSVMKDDTGILPNFLFASCLSSASPPPAIEESQDIQPNVFSEL